MFLARALRLKGIHVVGVGDRGPDVAKYNMKLVGWDEAGYSASKLGDAAQSGATFVGDNWEALVAHPDIEIIIECTGNPMAAVTHCLKAFEHGKHIINVTVEADSFCGPGLADKAREAGVIYSIAYGDQPALPCYLVDLLLS